MNKLIDYDKLYLNNSYDLYGDGLRYYIQIHGRLPQFWYDNQEAVSNFTE